MPADAATAFTRSLASLLAAPFLAFGAFIAGLAATSLVMAAWNSDVVYVLCFGVAFLGGLFVTHRTSRSLARSAGIIDEGAVVRTLIFYIVAVALLSFVLVGIINELRSQ